MQKVEVFSRFNYWDRKGFESFSEMHQDCISQEQYFEKIICESSLDFFITDFAILEFSVYDDSEKQQQELVLRNQSLFSVSTRTQTPVCVF